MKIFNVEQIRQADKYTIENEPITSIDLMERASNQLSDWIIDNINKEKVINIFIGPGNNGGDGLALARLLYEKSFIINVFLVKISDSLSNDAETNLQRLKVQGGVKITNVDSLDSLPIISENEIIIDALFGSGLNRYLDGFVASVVQFINASKATIIAIDIPSGLFAEDNTDNIQENIITADYTLTIQFPKLSFFFADNYKFVGEWHVIPIGLHQDFIDDTECDYTYLTREKIASKIISRKRFDHKGNFGHVFLVAGSYGKIGAAVLAAKACLRTGAGLLSVHTPRLGYEIIQTSIPEAMVSIDKFDKVVSKVPSLGNYTSVGIGPGIGKSHQTSTAIKDLLSKANIPLVLDADALNIISENPDYLNCITAGSIFTPHPKEFERLVGPSRNNYERLQKQMEFAKKYSVVCVLKGAFTSICSPDGKCVFNTTGNPGMAKGGCGDILLGMITALHAQGYSSFDAAQIGVYLHGLAADIAVTKTSEEALLSTDIIENIGDAFKYLRNKIK